MKIDIKLIVTVIYLVLNILSYRKQQSSNYIIDTSWIFTFLISTIFYLIFWIIVLIF